MKRWMPMMGLALVTGLTGTASVGAAAAPAWAVHCTTELDHPVLPAGQPTRTVVKVTVSAPERPSGIERPPVNLCVVLDRSGSMQGERIERARDAAIEALQRLDERDRFSLVVYNDTAETLIPPQPVRNRAALEQTIRAISTSGFTALYAGVAQGASEVRKLQDKRFVNRIILLSDGLANRGPSTPEELGRLGTALAKEFISVSTVGLGTGYNEDLMTRLAERSDGNAYFAAHSRELAGIFAGELGDVLNVAARDVMVTIEVPAGVRPVRIIGREGTIRGNKVEVYLNQLVGGIEKYALIEVEAPAGRPDQVIQIASANVSYEDVASNRRGAVQSQVGATYSASKEAVTSNRNADVAVVVGLNDFNAAKDAAVELSDQGKRSEAAALLRAQGAQMRQLAQEVQSPALEKQAYDLDQVAGQVEREGLDNETRKNFRTDSYQYRIQNK